MTSPWQDIPAAPAEEPRQEDEIALYNEARDLCRILQVKALFQATQLDNLLAQLAPIVSGQEFGLTMRAFSALIAAALRCNARADSAAVPAQAMAMLIEDDFQNPSTFPNTQLAGRYADKD